MSDRTRLHGPFGESVMIAEGNAELGNCDPRFSPLDQVINSREELIGLLDLNNGDPVYSMTLEGKCNIVDIDGASERIHANPDLNQTDVRCDAVMTRRNDVAVVAALADCIPLVTHNRSTNLLAVIHLGWKGAVGRLHTSVLSYAEDCFGAKPEETTAYLGPAISKESYVVEKLSDAQENEPDWQPFVDERDDGFHVDLPGFVVATLVSQGLRADSISKSTADTGNPKDNYFSHERHLREGVPKARHGFAVVQKSFQPVSAVSLCSTASFADSRLTAATAA